MLVLERFAPFCARVKKSSLIYSKATADEAGELFANLPAPLPALLAATSSCSPYLWASMSKEADWLRAHLPLSPEATEAALTLNLEAELAKSFEEKDLWFTLRQAKRRLSLLVALADVAGVWDVMRCTRALSDFADRAVGLTLIALLRPFLAAKTLPGQNLDDLTEGAGFVVLGMGKLGAYELNYSSDIDLICLFDESRYGDQASAARAVFLRVTRALTAALSQITEDGYVFRTDLRLRPDASVTPVCISMAAAEAYYESVGRTWERAAFIKARVIAGDLVAGRRFLKSLTPFVWRKHLDFAAIQDAHDMRLRIREHRGISGPIEAAGHNVKLGKGGIREIEFFTQTRQLIAGGRDVDLRDPTTLGGLAALASKGWINDDLCASLSQAYLYLRMVEHRLQMVQDAQTHDIPIEADARSRLARFCGFADSASFEADLVVRLTHIHHLTEEFFAPPAPDAPQRPILSAQTQSLVEGWRLLPATRSQRAQTVFNRLLPSLLQSLARAAHPQDAFVAFDQFLSGLPAGAQIFSLFEFNPHLVDFIVDILTSSPDLAQYLGRNRAVFDAVIGGQFFTPWPLKAGLIADLTQQLTQTTDYEAALEAARIWQKEWHFRIGVHHLRGLIDAFEAGRYYADLACAVIIGVWPLVQAEFGRKYGAMPGRGAILVGMGSLGAGALNARSDLDMIVIYDAEQETQSQGRRVLDARSYYARLTQAFVTAISAQMSAGRLYDVDMRLRPSGRQGPVATSFTAFQLYQENEAWSWEHLALTRAAPITGNDGLGADVVALRQALIRQAGSKASLAGDVSEMRAKLARAQSLIAPLEAKYGPGRLMDIELFAQFMGLRAGTGAVEVAGQLNAAHLAQNMSQSDAAALLESYRVFWKLRVTTQLLNISDFDLTTIGEGARDVLLRELGLTAPDQVAGYLARYAKQAQMIITSLLNNERWTHDPSSSGPKGSCT